MAKPPKPANAQSARVADSAARRRTVILEGPIARGILQIALPSVATMLLLTANSFLDRWFIAHLGTEAQAAVTNATQILFALSAGSLAVLVGAAARIGRCIGAQDEQQASQTLHQALFCALVLGIVLAAPVAALRDPILRALQVQPETMPIARDYLLVSMLAVPSLFLMQTFHGAFRGLGDTVRPLRVMIISVLVHATFNAALIFGVSPLGIPALGAVGGAIALNISQWVAIALYLISLPGTVLSPALRLRWKADPPEIRRLLKIGVPAGGQQLLRTGSSLLFTGILNDSVGADHATAAAAALGVGLVSEALAFMPGIGYQTAASAFVAQNLGAGQPERARRAGWSAAWQAMAVMSILGLLFLLGAEHFARFFLAPPVGSDAHHIARAQDAIAMTTGYLRAAFVAEPFLALSMVLTGALQGAGETRSPTLITAVTLVGLRLPLAWALARVYGVNGAWWAMTITMAIQGLWTAALFRRGRWLKTKA